MLAVLLKILTVLGIVLLCLLGLLILFILLVLFLPVSYRLFGRREASTGNVEAWAKMRWLFGILRADYRYPSPGRFRVKLAGVTVFDSGKPKKEKASEEKKTEEKKPEQKKPEEIKAEKAETSGGKQGLEGVRHSEAPFDDSGPSGQEGSGENESPRLTWPERICQRFRDAYEKIKYTILKICGKIKDIFEHADYYKELLKEEETRLLFGHARMRILKVLKSIRPRKVKADLRFGTGSPDTTGYALGIYGMLSAFLGKNINVTPDFEEAVLEGEIFLAGRITAYILLMNIGKLLLDRRLRTFIKRLKREDT